MRLEIKLQTAQCYNNITALGVGVCQMLFI